jgi:GH18 family chitinase
MDMSVMGSLSAYTYQSALSQTGNSGQAITQALASARSQVANVATLLSSGTQASSDPFATLVDSSSLQALASLAYTSGNATGSGAQSLQSLLNSLGGGSSSTLFSTSSTMPLSAAVLAPSATEALVRYAYDQSQNPTNAAQQVATSGQQSLLATGFNLLA